VADNIVNLEKKHKERDTAHHILRENQRLSLCLFYVYALGPQICVDIGIISILQKYGQLVLLYQLYRMDIRDIKFPFN